ncbi:hypothetical protein ACL9RF_12245 [Sphingobacterium sp. Mn56C]|uniref:hypothetical protein n=1 Tax=Sphingobacterium sp. Mn56C TaxID=3395261 RepID=UPI003BDAF3CA
MTKDTIIKVFEKSFPFPIWKIEVDSLQNSLAIEFRDSETTIPSFAVLDFRGQEKCAPFVADEKEWTLAAIQGDYLILKRFGTSSPIQAGIQIIHISTGRIIKTLMEYVLQEVYQDFIRANHRAVPSGMPVCIAIATGDTQYAGRETFKLPHSAVHYPIAYQGFVPAFIQELGFTDQLWLQPYGDLFIWSYHKEMDSTYQLHLCISDKTQRLDEKVILMDLKRLIPQPYFQVQEYIFFLSNTKVEIKAYLV